MNEQSKESSAECEERISKEKSYFSPKLLFSFILLLFEKYTKKATRKKEKPLEIFLKDEVMKIIIIRKRLIFHIFIYSH